MPDFLKCDDPWFRPVDIKLGPDGALYVADFYNRIIGHYEVPLNHPGRDREHGRIWRIVYRGTDGQQKLKTFRDLTRATDIELLAELNNPNLAVRMQTTEQLLARAATVGDKIQQAVAHGTAYEKAHGMWVLERLGKLKRETLDQLSKDKDRLVRVHAMRVLTERSAWTSDEQQLALAGLKDDDAFVQRNAAAALGAHPAEANLAPLLELHHKVPPADTHLLHQVRMALRDQMLFPVVSAHLEKDYFSGKNWNVPDARALADASLGIHNLESARFLQGYLDRVNDSLPNVERECHYVARYGPKDSAAWVLQWMQQKYPRNVAFQGKLIKTVQQAAQERGSALGATELALAETLTLKLLASDQVPLGIELAGLFKLPNTQDALVKVLSNPKANKNTRKNAVVALVAIDPKGNTAALARIINSSIEAIEVREQIASSLAGTNRPDAQAALLKALETAPARLQTTIAMGLAGSRRGVKSSWKR